ncbi:MAG TPA: hypothetical protein VFR34_09800, partial [Paracoccaceae bacterium]|nr:hypothetical protein [Paracoccaceae bacterium]
MSGPRRLYFPATIASALVLILAAGAAPGQQAATPAPGQMMQGQMPCPMMGYMMPGPMMMAPMMGQMMPGQMMPGQMQPGQMAPGQVMPGQMQPGMPGGPGGMMMRVDADGDGAVSNEEAIAWQEDMFAALDADGDEAVTKEEFLAAAAMRGPHHAARAEKMRARREARFGEFDTDGDGLLGLE